MLVRAKAMALKDFSAFQRLRCRCADTNYATASPASSNIHTEGERNKWESLVRVPDLQLHRACGVLQQADGLRVAHAFGRSSADADNAVADLQESQTVYTHGERR